ncbi:putative protein FAM90A23 [Oryctolagus cuniculus]|uniref:putative protein FAM90A23 n=1 Tax=Oryctolagus cuniculus TaxID=9986 RepID=UPI0007EE48AB|nr:putative protein FAM90A23 [Oryctolagus cuniculus]
MRKQQRGPAGLRVPPPEEENPRVKCKNCGAFGHMTHSRRCPIKCSDGTLTLQPMGPNKENLVPQKRQHPVNPGPLRKTELQKEENQRQDKLQSKAVLQKLPSNLQGRQQHSWKDVTESWEDLSQPSGPMPLNRAQETRVLHPDLTSQIAIQKSALKPSSSSSLLKAPELSRFKRSSEKEGEEVDTADPSPPAVKQLGQHRTFNVKQTDHRPNLSAFKIPKKASRTQDLDGSSRCQTQARFSHEEPQPSKQSEALRMGPQSKPSNGPPGKRSLKMPHHSSWNPAKRPRLSPLQNLQRTTQSPKHGTLQSLQELPTTRGQGRKASLPVSQSSPAPELNTDLQPPKNRVPEKTVQGSTTSHHPAPSCVPGASLRMVFSALGNNWWSCRFMTTPSPQPHGKPTPTPLDPPVPKKTEKPCVKSPLRLLYESLQISSSSEDSDWE